MSLEGQKWDSLSETETLLFPWKVLSKVSSWALLVPDNYFTVFSVSPALF